MNSWTQLVEQTRTALSRLSAEELETLAERAQQGSECMAKTSRNDGMIGVAGPVRCALSAEDRRDLAHQQRLLGDLLEGTSANLALLRRLRPSEALSRWER